MADAEILLMMKWKLNNLLSKLITFQSQTHGVENIHSFV